MYYKFIARPDELVTRRDLFPVMLAISAVFLLVWVRTGE